MKATIRAVMLGVCASRLASASTTIQFRSGTIQQLAPLPCSLSEGDKEKPTQAERKPQQRKDNVPTVTPHTVEDRLAMLTLALRRYQYFVQLAGDQMAKYPIDLELYRLGTGLAAQVPKLRAEIEEIQGMDVSALKPRELAKLRDRLLRLKLILAVCDPVRRERFQQKLPSDRTLTFEELASYLDAPAVRLV